MKKIILLFSFALFLFSCSETEPTIEFKILPIKEAQTPAFFEHGTIDTIAVKYE